MADSAASTAPTTNQQMESEVADLKANDTFTFTAGFLSFVQPKLYYTHCNLSMAGDIEGVCWEPTERAEVDKIWPQHMLTASNISILVYLDETKHEDFRHHSDFYAVFHFFSSLARFLCSSGPSKPQLQVKFLTSGPPVSKLLRPKILQPLDVFKPKLEVEPADIWTPRRPAPDSEKK